MLFHRGSVMAGIAGVFMNWTQKQTQDTKNRKMRQGENKGGTKLKPKVGKLKL